MRTAFKFTAAMALVIPLAGFLSGCESSPLTAQPVAAELTDQQAAYLARGYLDHNSIPVGHIVREERVPNAWWFYYETQFNAAARPPSSAYLVQVADDGNVKHLQ